MVRYVARIAVVHVPFNSHTEAAIRLSRVLARQGHEVVAWGATRYREEIEAAGARFEHYEPDMPNAFGFMSFVAATAEVAEQRSEQLIEEVHAHDVDLLIHDSMVLAAQIAGDYLGIPRVVSHPMFPIVVPHRVAFRGEPDPSTIDDRAPRAQFELRRTSIAQRWGVELEADQVIHSSGPATVAYTTDEIVGGVGILPGWHLVGPLMTLAPPAAPPRERPLVYVCFGTSYNRRVELYHAVIQALANEPVDVLISRGRDRAWDSLGPLPSNVTVRDYVPNREALTSASLHITHGGCNSVHETLLAGVPMVCIPQAYDQFPLCGRIQVLGAGLIASESSEEIGAAVRLVLGTEKATARARDLGEHLSRYDGESKVAEMVDRALSADPVPAA